MPLSQAQLARLTGEVRRLTKDANDKDKASRKSRQAGAQDRADELAREAASLRAEAAGKQRTIDREPKR